MSNRLTFSDIICISFEVDGETYLFRFKKSRWIDMLRAVGRLAADPDVSFTWCDAAVIAARIKQEVDVDGVA